MSNRRKLGRSARIKVGTILDEKVVERLKERSHNEHKSISAIIEEAVLRFDSTQSADAVLRLRALESAFAVRFNISNDDLRAIMDSDYYDQ
jgi:hypothetical protein